MKMKNRMVDKSRNTPYDEAYKALRTNLEFLHTAQDLRVILLVAPEEQSGKCAFVQNLAVVLASKERQVLLMDCDLRCGALTKHLSTAAGGGVSELLAAEQKPMKKVQQIAQNVDFLPCGAAAADPSELFLSRTAVDRLAELRAEYDYIILDAPAVQTASEAIDLSRMADGVVVLMQADTTKMQSAENCKKKLQAVNASILGAVLNGSEA